MPTLRAFVVLVIFVLSTLLLVPLQYVSTRLKLKIRRAIPNKFNRYLCALFGIRITVIGKPIQDRGVLMVANHTGYFDILIMAATARVSFVAKSEVAGWPFIGMMSRLQESIFVERTRRSRAGIARDELRVKDEPALADLDLRSFVSDSLEAGWLTYYEPYERVHRSNLARVVGMDGPRPAP